jgi:endonuclease YncB( thermonuclease family)
MALQFVTAFVLAVFCLSFQSSAAVPNDVALRDFLRTKLSYTITESCPVTERVGSDPGGPFERTDLCNEGDFKNAKTITGKVYRVVDGDTIHFYAFNKLLAIRMLGIDTPELHFRALAQPKWGIVAKQNMLSMVGPGDIITLELDQVRCDRYGRVLAHVFKNGVNLNFEQVRRGLAANYCIAPNMKHCQAYAMAYVKAQQEGLGFHRDACAVTPYVWRRALNGEVMSKRLSDSRTGEVFSPSDYHRVPVAYRVFVAETVHQ